MSAWNKQKGFTLVELLVAVVAGVMLLAAMYMLFRSSSEVYTSQEQIVDIRQDIRATMAYMARNIRMAGFDPNRAAGACAGITSANVNSLRVQYDENGNGTCENDLDFMYVPGEKALKVQLSGTGGYQPLTYDISSCRFSYGMSNGTFTETPADLEDIRMVGVEICGRISGAYSKKYDTPQCLNATVRCRNMGLK